MINSWELNRIGLTNFWYYDEEVFDFVDGRMILTGNNGAGKSLTMQSFIPFLLDGNMKPERLDPFRTRDKQMINYLLEEDSDLEERIGYLHIEFKRKNIDEYKTLGIGLRARKNSRMESWFFILNGPTRVGEKFRLYKQIGDKKVTLTKTQLENQIKGLGEVIKNQSDYIRKVNEIFFGFETIEEYKELLDLLIKIRSPKLSNEFKPTAMIEILNGSLQTLPEEYLRQGADIIRQIDEQKDRLEDLNRELFVFEKIEKNFDNYNKKIMFNRTTNYLETLKGKEKKEHELNSKKKDLEDVKNQILILRNREDSLDSEDKNLNLEKRTLEKYDVFKLKEEKQILEREKLEKEEILGNKEGTLDQDREKLQSKNRELRDKSRDEELDLRKIETLLMDMEEKVKLYEFPEYKLMKLNILNFFKEFDGSRHRFQIRKRREELKKAREIILEYEKCKKEYAQELAKLDREKRSLREQEEVKSQYENQLSEIKEELIEKIYLWREKNKELRLEEEDVIKIVDEISNYDRESNFDKIREIVYNRTAELTKVLQGEEVLQRNSLEKYKEELKKLEKELEVLKNQKEPEPERKDEVLKNRERLKELEIPYVEFYKYIDFQEEMSSEERDKLEEAFSNMGILDSIVVEEKSREKVFNSGSGLCDKYIFVEELDKNIGIDFHNLKTDTFLDAEGNYKLGILEGNVGGNYKNRFIGLEKREKYRQEQILILEIKIKEVKEELEKLETDIKRIVGSLKVLQEERESFPKPDDLLVALRGLEDIIYLIDRILDNIKNQEEKVEEQEKKMEIKSRELFEYSEKNGTPKKIDILETMIENFSEYNEDYNNLLNMNVEYRGLKKELVNIKETISDLENRIGDVSFDIKKLSKELEQKSQRIENINRQLESDDAKEIARKAEYCIKRLVEIKYEKDKVGKELGANENEEKNIQERVEGIEQELEELTLRLECSKKIFLREVDLGYFDEVQEEEPKKIATKIYEKLKDIRMFKNVENNLVTIFNQNNGELSKYSLKLFYINDYENDYNMEERRYEITTKFNGEEQRFKKLLEILRENTKNLKNILKEKDKELFRDILGKQINQKIRRMIEESKAWVNRIDNIMQETESFGSGLRFSLVWKNKVAETEEQMDSNKLVNLLGKDIEILKDEDLENLSKHFQSKINIARRRNEAKDNRETFYQIIKEILDYRQWFEFQLKFEKTGGRKKELTDREFSKLSGGEKAMAMYIPLFSAAIAKYEGAREDAPKIIALDEAFAGIDNKNIENLFKMMVTLDFNFILTSQSLWGTFSSAKSLAIYQLARHNNSKFVTTIKYIWNGKRLVII